MTRAPNGEPQRFFEEVVLAYDGDDCLPWPFATNPYGYGLMRCDGRLQLVSRIICERAHGPAPTPDRDAAHSCGNGHLGCCAKRHLRWATRAENHADKLIHGTTNRGGRNGQAKLTEDDVREIRSLTAILSQYKIADLFGISRGCISDIHSRKSWAWLE